MKVWFPVVRTSSGTDVFTRRLAGVLGEAGIEVVVTWLPHALELLPGLHRLVRTPPGCDVIHANSWTAAALLDRPLPLVVTVHHLVHDPAYAPYRSFTQALYHRLHVYPMERRAIDRAECVTAVSRYVAGTVTSLMDRTEVQVIPNWVDCEHFHPGENEFDKPAAPFRVLCVANATRRKGHDLLQPLASLLGDSFELRVTGGLRGGPGTGKTDERIVNLGRLSDSELLAEYQRCDVVVSVSRYEGFGYTALEAMACGKPVVAFAAGGLRDVVRHGETGFLLEVGDIGGVAARIRELSKSRDLRLAMGDCGREHALGQADAWRGYVAIYERALRGKSPIPRRGR